MMTHGWGRNSSFKIEIHGQTPNIICLTSSILWVQRNTFASVYYLFLTCDIFETKCNEKEEYYIATQTAVHTFICIVSFQYNFDNCININPQMLK